MRGGEEVVHERAVGERRVGGGGGWWVGSRVDVFELELGESGEAQTGEDVYEWGAGLLRQEGKDQDDECREFDPGGGLDCSGDGCSFGVYVMHGQVNERGAVYDAAHELMARDWPAELEALELRSEACVREHGRAPCQPAQARHRSEMIVDCPGARHRG